MAAVSIADSSGNGGRTGPIWALLRRWPIAVLAAVLGVGLGVGFASLQPTAFTAESRVAVGAGDLSSGAIAGFPTAAGELAANYARYVNDRGLRGDGAGGADLSGVALSASPIPDSNVIRIEAVSTDEQQAIDAADLTAQSLVRAVNEPRGADTPASLLASFNSAAIESAQARAAEEDALRLLEQAREAPTAQAARLADLRARVVNTGAAADEAELRQSAIQSQYLEASSASRSADLEVVNPATVLYDTSSSLRQRYALLGLTLGLVVALLVAFALDRRSARASDRNLRRTQEPKHSSD